MILNNKEISRDWWVVHTKLQAEAKAIKQLTNQGFITYCPMYRKECLITHQINIKTTPLFPRYTFIQADNHAQKNIHTIRSTYGVSQLLKIGEVPTHVPNQVILNLKKIEIAQIQNTESYFKVGENVKILKGLYKGLEAIYHLDDGLKRSVVLLNILNKETPFYINKQQLEKV